MPIRWTTNPQTIIRWAEERGGSPALVTGGGGGPDNARLRIRFDAGEESPEEMQDITWKRFLENFEKQRFVFVYEEQSEDGRISHFHEVTDGSNPAAATAEPRRAAAG